MNNISTQNLNLLPNIENFKKLCKSISVLDAIISQDWESRYYSYQKEWDENEEFFEMRNGSGDEIKILFSSNGCVINGFAHESEMCDWKEIEIKEEKSFFAKLFGSKEKKTELVQNISKGVVDSLPNEFHNFIFGEPVKSSGTTFCIWRKQSDSNWNVGQIKYPNDDYLDGSSDLMYIFDSNPKTYKDWAEEYFDDTFEDRTLDIELVEYIYGGGLITKEIVEKINPDIEDYEQLKTDLNDIGFEHQIE
ncbi:hypothetical protein [Psychroflexus sp. MES1-P1E]|jgi:hypothetical protein|uniref:hypothetical protein n=1 Tax=Psychroflexus sp. MES1-P1E TaxID=2058320 RepID=UPI000C7D3620|nr:hypothetical protein [Psychroflexus sp. MES1-P1E]PKG41450.1 hypothetical protein CXF67_15570 [Psychroflexus sp. MES1-P1E]